MINHPRRESVLQIRSVRTTPPQETSVTYPSPFKFAPFVSGVVHRESPMLSLILGFVTHNLYKKPLLLSYRSLCILKLKQHKLRQYLKTNSLTILVLIRILYNVDLHPT